MLRAVNEIATQLASTDDQDMLLQQIVQRATGLLSVNGGYLYLYHPEQRELELAITYNLSPAEPGVKLRQGTRLRLGEGLAGRVVEQGRSLAVEDYHHWEGQAAAYRHLAIGGAAGVPLRWQGAIIGSLHVHMIGVKRRFSKQELEMLELFANHAAVAIGRAQEQQEIKHLRQRLFEIGQQILQSRDIEEILQQVAQAIREHTPFKMVAFSLFEQPIVPSRGEVGRVIQTVTAGLTQAEEADLLRMTTSQGFIPCQQIIQKGKRLGGGYYITPSLIPEIVPRSIKSRHQGSSPGEWGPYDNLFFMLEQSGQILGRISVADPVHGRVPSEEELEPLKTLTNMAAIAIIESGRRRDSEHYQEQLRGLAIHDPLTGLYNRRYLNEALEREIARAKRYDRPISLIIMDLDDFHRVNDTLGHLVGDRVLMELATLIKGEIREADYLFRFGGDEFLILMPETDGQVKQILERLQQTMARWNETSQFNCPPLGLSVGISTWNPADGRSLDEVLAEADEKLYMYKRTHHSKGYHR
jgi:diguanylate cyclase (GGDEF)-like protein